MESGELVTMLLAACGGGLTGTWAMLGWTNGRIRELEMHRVTPDSCDARHSALTAINQEVANDIKDISVALALIKGHLGIRE